MRYRFRMQCDILATVEADSESDAFVLAKNEIGLYALDGNDMPDSPFFKASDIRVYTDPANELELLDEGETI